MKGTSIRATVLGWQLAAMLLLGLVAVLVAYILAVRSFEALRNLELAQIADAVARHGIEPDSNEDEQPGDFLSQVWDARGRLVYASHEPPVAQPRRNGEFDFGYDDRTWHGFMRTYQGQTILVAREAGAHRALFLHISLPLLSVVGGMSLLLAVVLGLRVHRALAPLTALSQALRARDPASLAPLSGAGQPRELTPLVDTLNALLGRADELLERQRCFVADAAHELRTPVGAIRLYAQLAARSDAADTRTHALENIVASCDRATHLVEQLLALARLDPAHRPAAAPVALDALARQCVVAHAALAESRGIDLGLGGCAAVSIAGSESELQRLLDNLIDNAVRYTPPGGRVDVTVEASGEAVTLCVLDSGPGIPEAEHARVFERFHRVVGNGQPGTGLGLAIVKGVAERHGAGVRLENRPGGGLQVSVRWPVPLQGRAVAAAARDSAAAQTD